MKKESNYNLTQNLPLSYQTRDNLNNLFNDGIEGYDKPPDTGGQTSIPEGTIPTKVSQLQNDLNYVRKAELSPYAKKVDIPKKISELENDLNYLTKHQDLSAYAKKSDIPTKVSQLKNDLNFLTKHQDISGKADRTELFSGSYNDLKDKPEILNIEEVSSKEYVNNLIKYKADRSELFSGNFEDLHGVPEIPSIEGLATEEYVNNKIATIETTGVDLTGYAKNEDIPTKLSELENDTNFLTKHQDISGKADRTELFSKSYNDLTDRPEIPSIVGLASEEYVDNAIQDKADRDEIPSINGLASEEYVDNAIQDKADRDEIPSIEGLATEEYVNNKIEDINVQYDDSTLRNEINNLTSQYNDILSKFNQLNDKVNYVDPVITSFKSTPTATTYEIGTIIDSITFNWTTNKDIVSQTLTDTSSLSSSDRTATVNKKVSGNKSFILLINDGTKSASKLLSFYFKHYRYWGTSTEPEVYDSDFIKSLSSKEFATDKTKSDFKVNAKEDQYVYYCIPSSWGQPSFYVGGFEGGFSKVSTIDFLNNSGNTTSFDIWKTDNIGLGDLSINIK